MLITRVQISLSTPLIQCLPAGSKLMCVQGVIKRNIDSTPVYQVIHIHGVDALVCLSHPLSLCLARYIYNFTSSMYMRTIQSHEYIHVYDFRPLALVKMYLPPLQAHRVQPTNQPILLLLDTHLYISISFLSLSSQFSCSLLT